MKSGRIRVFAGAAMAVAVVALFALLLRGFAPGRTNTGPGTSGPATTTPTTPPNSWHTYKGLSYTTTQQGDDVLPAFTPSDPSTVYAVTLDQPNPPKLRRTTDAGASWTTLALPGDTSNVQQVQVFVNPLSAKTVFVAITTGLPPTSSTADCANLALGPRHGGIQASGVVPCVFEYISKDSGAHWQQLHFPTTGVLVDAQPVTDLPQGHVLRTQGSVLFSLLGCGPMCGGPSADLVKSTDGGATWQLADSGIRAAGQSICDFAPAPTGAEVYAIATESCNAETMPILSLWHSADAGAHWTRVGELPSRVATGIKVVARASGRALVYINMPPATVQGHGASIQYGPTNLQASTDGGHTWHNAPAGLPSGVKYPSPAQPLGVLSDGTIIEGFVGPGDSAGTPRFTLFGWKYGQSAWAQIAPTLDREPLSLTVAPGASGDTLWVVVNSSTSPQASDISLESFHL